MAEQERAIPHHEIEIPVAVGVDDVRAVAALYKDGYGRVARTEELTPPASTESVRSYGARDRA